MGGAVDVLTANLAPGPGGNPITDQLRPFEEDPLRFLLRMREAHGNVVRLHLWPQLCHLVSDPNSIRYVLSTHAQNYHGPPAMQRGRLRDRQSLLGSGPQSLSDEFQLTRRMEKLGSEVFHQKQVETFAPIIVRDTAAMLRRWQKHAETGEPFDAERDLLTLTQTILGDTLFHADLSRIGPTIARIMAGGPPQSRVSVFQQLEQAKPESNRPWLEAMAILNQFVADLVEERRRQGPGEKDLLSILLFDRDELTGEFLPEQKVLEAAWAFLIAGHSAVASLLTWTCFLLSQHQGIVLKVRAEVDATLGSRPPTTAHLPKLPYTHMVLQESMRLYPPVWMFAPRMTTKDDSIEGYRIPARSIILISPYVLHRHPDYWERPEEFEPARFAGSTPAAYLPYGAGPWGCVGSQFGMLEARLVLPMLLQRYDWELKPGYRVELDPQLALRPRHGLPIIVRARPLG